MDATADALGAAQRYVDAWTNDDLVTLLDCYADGFTLHYFGSNPFTGSHVGKDAALSTLLEVSTRAPRRLLGVDDVLAGPGSAVVVAREELTVDGQQHEIRRALRYRVVDGRFAESWLYEEDQALVDRAWADPSPD